MSDRVGGRNRTRTCKRLRAVVFKTTALPVRLPFPKDCGFQIAGCGVTAANQPPRAVNREILSNPQSEIRNPKSPEPHMQKMNLRFQISLSRFQIRDPSMLKNR